MRSINQEEKERCQKFTDLEEMGEASLLKLQQSSVLVVGAGGLGSGVLPVLCASGIGHIGVVEFDTVEKGNLQRQTLFTSQDEGRAKIEAAAGRLQALNPSMHLEQFDQRLNQRNADGIINGYDVVVDCTDNFQTRYLINDVCGRLKKPVVYGAISDYEGQVMVLHHHMKADLRNIYPELPDNEKLPDDEGEPGGSEYPGDNDVTNGIMPTLPHITGTIQANETIKLLTGKGRLLDGEMLLLNVFSNDYHIIEL